MKVRVTVDVGSHERYVIARWFGAASTDSRDRTRARATRRQVRRFVAASVRLVVQQQADDLRGRHLATARRLAAGAPSLAEPLPEPTEYQRGLSW